MITFFVCILCGAAAGLGDGHAVEDLVVAGGVGAEGRGEGVEARCTQTHRGQLRRDLLDGAYTVGSAGNIRLVETYATRSPLAFGLFDKVIAMPVGFMALPDRAARDRRLEDRGTDGDREDHAPQRKQPARQ